MWGVFAFFNPLRSVILEQHLERAATAARRQGLPTLIVELAFGDAPFRIPLTVADRVLQLRSTCVLWHKERLLNLGIAALPAECRFVTWLDGDVLFENDQWVNETIARLDQHPVVQPFERVTWTDAEGASPAPGTAPGGVGEGHELLGMGRVLAEASDRPHTLADYVRHGHTGFGWSARREVIEQHGLYDGAIVGGGDYVNAHIFAANADFLAGRNLYARLLTEPQRADIRRWGLPLAEEIAGDIGWTPGRVTHLYHGPSSGRRYTERQALLREDRFDPVADLARDDSGCWRWNSDKPRLHQRVHDYFFARAVQSDGRPSVRAAIN